VALFPILIFAFLGGVILNIMPCVLPVLSLKLTSILKQSDASQRQIRQSFLMSAAGIILSFMVLGGGLLSMRSAGLAIGWGIQFQNPVFLGIMMLLMVGFALMMIDRVILPVPDFARRWSGKLTTGTGGWHDMASGALATILATPCSAPFVGTAIAFAFTAPPFAMLIIFLAMGLGLAAPWLCVAMFPQLAGYLPRPGKWLIYVRHVLAVGLLITAAWLGFVLATVITDAPSSYSGNWQKWQPGLAEEYARNGDIVLVDVTADWCLTCKANKFLVLDLQNMQDYLNARDVVLLKADWTKPDDDILDYLSSFGRYGIPFNIVYGPDALDGITLPELLTEESVFAAIETADLKPNSEK
jgi:suppressor for copper-sensitivity B